MTEEEKRAHALHAGLKALEVFHSLPAERTVTRLIQYTMLGYNWINAGIIGNSVLPKQSVEPPMLEPEKTKIDPVYIKAGPHGG